MIATTRWVVPAMLVLLSLPCVASCDRTEAERGSEVVVYVSADPQVAAPILQAFESTTGIRVRALHDTEATKTTGLANRIRREAARPRADVFWSSEPFAIERLASEGLLQPARHPDLKDHPSAWRRADDRWFAFGGRARVIAYRPDRLDEDDLPRHWESLASPRWQGEIAIADPRFGTTRGHVAALATNWGDPRFERWLAGLAANDVRVMPGGNAATVDAVVRGEVLLGCTDVDDVIAARRRGMSIAAIVPRHEPDGVEAGGSLLLPNAAGLVTGGPNPGPGAALVAWLAAAEVEARLRESPSRNQPIAHPEVDSGIEVPASERFDEPDPWRYDLEDVAGNLDDAVDRAIRRWVDGAGPAGTSS